MDRVYLNVKDLFAAKNLKDKDLLNNLFDLLTRPHSILHMMMIYPDSTKTRRYITPKEMAAPEDRYDRRRRDTPPTGKAY